MTTFTIIIIIAILVINAASLALTAEPYEEEVKEEELIDPLEGQPITQLSEWETAVLDYVEDRTGVRPPEPRLLPDTDTADGRCWLPVNGKAEAIGLCQEGGYREVLAHEVIHWLHWHAADWDGGGGWDEEIQRLCREALGTDGRFIRDNTVPYEERPHELLAFGLEVVLQRLAEGAYLRPHELKKARILYWMMDNFSP